MVAFEAPTSRPAISSFPPLSSSMSGSLVTGSAAANPVPVLPRADVPRRVERKPAQRARRPALAHDRQGSLGEGARGRRGDRDAQYAGRVVRQVLGQRFERLVAELLRFDDDPLLLAIPGQRDRADPEVLHQRLLERRVVGERVRGYGGDGGAPAGAPQDLVEQLIEPLSELTD